MGILRLQEEVQSPDSRFTGANAYLRIYANQSFYGFDGTEVTEGQVGGQNWYQQYTCPISAGVITIPEVQLQTTTDSSVRNATYTAVFYNSAGRQMNTKLGNFFVDPQYLQSSVQSNIIVSGAGTSDANGTYTYRGQHNGRNYWNLFGQADSVTDYAIVWTGSLWIMTDFSGATLYTIDTNSQYPWDSIWSVAGGNVGVAPVPAVAQDAVVVAATWAELTISNQGFVPNFWTRTTWDVQQIKQYINLIGNNVPWASEIVGGKTYLTRDPVLSTEPRAVASNDYDWLAINQTIYLDGPEYQGDLAAAIAGIGSTVCELRITSNVAISVDTDIPANILLSFEGNGKFTASGGVTVNIASMREQPVKKIFYTNSTNDYILIGFGAVAECKWAWWGGSGTGSDDNHAFTQMFASLSANAGGRWTIQDGTFYCTNQIVPSHTHGSGTGSGFEGATFNNQGTVLRNSNPTGTDPIFKLHQATVQVTLEDMAFDQEDSTTAFCLYLYGTQNAGSMFNIMLNRLCFNALADSAITLVQLTSIGSNTDWENVGITFFQCTWGCSTNTKCITTNSVNSKYWIASPLAFLGIGSTFFQSNDSGWCRMTDWDIRGPAGADYSATESLNRVQAGVNITSTGTTRQKKTMTITDATTPRFTMDDLGQAVTGTGIPANNYFTEIIDDYHAVMYYAATSTISNGTANVYRQNAPTGLAHAGAVFNGQRAPVLFESYIDEAVCYSVLFTGNTTEIFTPVNFVSCQFAGRIRFEGTVIINSTGGTYYSLSWEQSGGLSPIIYSNNDVIVYTTLLRGAGSFIGTRVLPTGYLYGNNSNLFAKPVQNWAQQNDDFTNTQTNQQSQLMLPDNTGQFVVADNTHAVLTTTTTQHDELLAPSENKVLWRVGLSNEVTRKPELYYDYFRDGATGYLRRTGNQSDALFKGHYYDDKIICAVGITGDILTGETGITSPGYIHGTAKTAGNSVGYGVGSGHVGIVQGNGSGRSTAVSVDAYTCIIQTDTASLANGAEATFTVTNACCGAYDQPDVVWRANYSPGVSIFVSGVAAGSFNITTRNNSGGADTTAHIIQFYIGGGSAS